MQEDFSRLQIINNFYISIEEQRVSRYKTVPQQVNFEFNSERLDTIAQIQRNHNSLSFDTELLTNLRYYSLWQYYDILRSGLIFTSYYCQGEQKIAVISSNISVQGQISQQIRHDFFVNFSLLKKIINAHYWSIEQIFKQLPLTYQNKSYLISWISPLLITFGLATLILDFIPNTFWLLAIVVIIIFILTKFTIQYLAQRYLVNFILQQLLFGSFSYNTTRRKLGLTLLKYFG